MDDLSFSPRAALAMGILTGLATLPLSAGQAAWDARLEMHAPETTARFNAVCLDGSPAGYYFRPASNPAAATKWKFHFCGGGWCTSEETCYSRGFGGSPHPQMGSSQSWPPWLSTLLLPPGAAFYGLMSQNESSVNPFGDWNFVWLAYCDGSSQLSDRDAPFEFNGSLVHLRGRAILDAHLYELERVHGFLSTATEVSQTRQVLRRSAEPPLSSLTGRRLWHVGRGAEHIHARVVHQDAAARARGAPGSRSRCRLLVGHAQLLRNRSPVARSDQRQHPGEPVECYSAGWRGAVPGRAARRSPCQVLLAAVRVCLP